MIRLPAHIETPMRAETILPATSGLQIHPPQWVLKARVVAEWVVAHLVRVEWSSSHSYLSTLKGFDLAALNAGKEDAVTITAANSNAHDSQRKRRRVSDKPTIRPSDGIQADTNFKL